MDRKRISIVEDEVVSAASLKKNLTHLGYEVISIITSGEEAINKIRESQPDLIFMDINLAGKMDGIETSAVLQANFDIPIIFVTNYDNEEVLQRALITSPYQYLVKPVNKVDLRNTVEITLNRHNLEKMFKKREKWLEIILGNTIDSVIITDSKGIVFLMNSAAENLTGWKQQETIGKDYTEIFSIKNEFGENSIENPFISALQFNITVDFPENSYIISRNGSKKNINGYAIPINDDTGKPDGILLLVREFDERNGDSLNLKDKKNELNKLILERTADLMKENVERKRAEESLHTTEKKYRTIVETAQEGIWLSDNNFKTTFVNQKIADMLGYSINELLLTHLFDHLEKKSKDLFLQEIENKSAKNQDVREFLFECKDGSNLWAIVTSNILFDDFGNRIGILSMVTDITERKIAEKEILDAKLKAEESSKLKSVLMMNLNHELRTPMNGIIGFASLLKDEISNPDLLCMIEDIHFSGTRLMKTINSIMEFAALESGQIKPEIIEFNIYDNIKTVIDNFEKEAKDKNLNYRVIIKKDEIIVKSDIDMIKTIVSKIIDNAVKYTQNGEVSIKLDMVTEDSGNFMILKISDTGIGIPLGKQNEIFKEFKQASEGFGRGYEGLGLGLTVAKKMADMLGIQISMESIIAKGSVFTLKIPSPYAPESKITLEKKVDFSDKNGKNKDSKQINELQEILIIEDNIININLITAFLKNICSVDYVLSGEAALEIAVKKKYSLILTDINLGSGINGIDSQKKIRKIKGYENVPNIAVTGYSTSEDRNEFLREGFDEFIPKPFTKVKLIKTIEKFVKVKK